MVADYLFVLTKSNPGHQRYDADDALLQSLAHSIKHPEFMMHPTTVVEDIVNPVLTQESYDKLIEMIGRDWLDSYYVVDYV